MDKEVELIVLKPTGKEVDLDMPSSGEEKKEGEKNAK